MTQESQTRSLDPARLAELAGAYRLSQAIYVATKLRLPDYSRERALDADELAQLAGAYAPTLRRLLRPPPAKVSSAKTIRAALG